MVFNWITQIPDNKKFIPVNFVLKSCYCTSFLRMFIYLLTILEEFNYDATPLGVYLDLSVDFIDMHKCIVNLYGLITLFCYVLFQSIGMYNVIMIKKIIPQHQKMVSLLPITLDMLIGF